MQTSRHFARAMRRFARPMAAFAAVIGALMVMSAARADDSAVVADWRSAAPLPDSTLRIVSRKLHLPPGHWTFIERVDSRTRTTNGEEVAISTAWAVRIEDGRFRMAVALSLPARHLVGIHRWGPDPCVHTDGQIHQRDVSASRSNPECLSIEGFHAFMQSMRRTNLHVAQWFETHGFGDDDGLVHILYTRSRNGTFGRASVLLPIQAFQSDADAIGWSDTLPGILGPFLDGELDDATLPEPAPLPAP
jgi:hypothetical protein